MPELKLIAEKLNINDKVLKRRKTSKNVNVFVIFKKLNIFVYF